MACEDTMRIAGCPEHMPISTLRRIFKAFQYRDFRLMWFGACTSSIGTWMQIVAQGWLIYRLSHSAFLLALDQFLGGIPIFLFSLIGGVVADRIERRNSGGEQSSANGDADPIQEIAARDLAVHAKVTIV